MPVPVVLVVVLVVLVVLVVVVVLDSGRKETYPPWSIRGDPVARVRATAST